MREGRLRTTSTAGDKKRFQNAVGLLVNQSDGLLRLIGSIGRETVKNWVPPHNLEAAIDDACGYVDDNSRKMPGTVSECGGSVRTGCYD